MEHSLKTWPKYFKAIEEGRKLFDLRENDRGFEAGDWLVLEEFNPERQAYTGRKIWVQVISVWKDLPNLPKGFVIMDLGAVCGQGTMRRR
jgi:hypothetical protein